MLKTPGRLLTVSFGSYRTKLQMRVRHFNDKAGMAMDFYGILIVVRSLVDSGCPDPYFLQGFH